MMTDPIADMLSRIRNAALARKKEVCLPYSKLKYAISQILLKEGYLEQVEYRPKAPLAERLRLVLKFAGDKPKIKGIKRVSKPGCRVYKKYQEIKPVNFGYGIAIVSTNKGLMTDKESRQAHLGGEVICEVW